MYTSQIHFSPSVQAQHAESRTKHQRFSFSKHIFELHSVPLQLDLVLGFCFMVLRNHQTPFSHCLWQQDCKRAEGVELHWKSGMIVNMQFSALHASWSEKVFNKINNTLDHILIWYNIIYSKNRDSCPDLSGKVWWFITLKYLLMQQTELSSNLTCDQHCSTHSLFVSAIVFSTAGLLTNQPCFCWNLSQRIVLTKF